MVCRSGHSRRPHSLPVPTSTFPAPPSAARRVSLLLGPRSAASPEGTSVQGVRPPCPGRSHGEDELLPGEQGSRCRHPLTPTRLGRKLTPPSQRPPAASAQKRRPPRAPEPPREVSRAPRGATPLTWRHSGRDGGRGGQAGARRGDGGHVDGVGGERGQPLDLVLARGAVEGVREPRAVPAVHLPGDAVACKVTARSAGPDGGWRPAASPPSRSASQSGPRETSGRGARPPAAERATGGRPVPLR